MADIFLSYASEDASAASEIASALEIAGYSLWWDRRIMPGETFHAVIARELAAARAVIVLWSSASVQSEWVKEEIDEAIRRKILVPATIEPIEPPLGYRRIQSASLIGWQGEKDHSGFKTLLLAISSLLSANGSAPPVLRESARSEPLASPAPSLAPDVEQQYKRLVANSFALIHESKVTTKRTTPRSGRYRVRVWVESVERIRPIGEIKSVTYHLWHDFPRPVMKRTNLETNFDIWLSVFGEFPILAIIETLDGERIEAHRYIDLPGRPPD